MKTYNVECRVYVRDDRVLNLHNMQSLVYVTVYVICRALNYVLYSMRRSAKPFDFA